MKKKSISKDIIPHDPLIPFELQDITVEDLVKLCEEFAASGQKDNYVVGYNPQDPMCMCCTVQGYCMRLGRELNIGDRVKQIKRKLGVKTFYSDHKIFQLSEGLYLQYLSIIKEFSDEGNFIDADKLKSKLEGVFTDTLNTSTNIFAHDMFDRILRHPNITLTKDNKIVWNEVNKF